MWALIFGVQLLHQDQDKNILLCKFEVFNLTASTSEFSCCMRHRVSYDDLMSDLGFIEMDGHRWDVRVVQCEGTA